MDKTSAIGVFDSGIGGLSVWKEIVQLLPNESITYYGDGKNCPYGNKSAQEVIGYVDHAVQYFIANDCKMVVLACNAATAFAIAFLRKKYPYMIFVGMEPAVKPAARMSHSGVIGILATKATLGGKLFLETSEQFAGTVKIISHVGEGFVELVENDQQDSNEAVECVKLAIEPMLEQGADHIVLGCTHYPFLIGAIKKVIGDRDVTIVDPAPAIAKRVKCLLSDNKLIADKSQKAVYNFMTQADNDYQNLLQQKACKIKLNG